MRQAIVLTALLFGGVTALYSRTFEFRYVLEMERGNDAIPVSPLSGFEAGDRVRIRLLASQDSYCYLAVGQADGYFQLTRGRAVSADGWLELPDIGWLRFDRRPGVEMVYLIVASRPVPELERLDAAGEFRESALLRVRTLYQTGVRGERVAQGDLVRVRQKVLDDRPTVILEPIRMRHR